MRAGALQASRNSLVKAVTSGCPTFVSGAGLSSARVVSDRCLIASTQHGRPYIDRLSLTRSGVIGCAVGCNGYAAKSSDEVGRLAARMMVARTAKEVAAWGDGIRTDVFRAVPDYDHEAHAMKPNHSFARHYSR